MVSPVKNQRTSLEPSSTANMPLLTELDYGQDARDLVNGVICTVCTVSVPSKALCCLTAD